MDLTTEQNWFVESNWEHQKNTEIVTITPKVKSPAVVKVTVDYLKSIGIKVKDEEIASALGAKSIPSIIVNLVEKEIAFSGRYFNDGRVSFQAYPSQVLEFLEQNKGRLTGKKFGL